MFLAKILDLRHHAGRRHPPVYSATPCAMTEGRAYGAAEYRGWPQEAGLGSGPVVPTLIHRGAPPDREP